MTSESNLAGDHSVSRVFSPRLAYLCFGVLFAMHLLDFIDRWILSAVLKDVKASLNFQDDLAGRLQTMFLVTFTFVSPLMGWMADRTRRVRLLGLGVGLWSLSTVLCGLAQSYWQLASARCLLGIGEATYGVIAPTLLADMFRKEVRSRVMSMFYLALPLGGAIGVTFGGAISQNGPYFDGQLEGWRLAFFLVGAPGLLAAIGSLFLPEPQRGAMDHPQDGTIPTEPESPQLTRDDYWRIFCPSYLVAVFGMAAYTFAIGALGHWFPTFLKETRGWLTIGSSAIPIDTAIGGITALSAILGMTTGGWLSDRLSRVNRSAPFLVSGTGMFLAVPLAATAILTHNQALCLTMLFCAETLMFVNTGPCNAVIANVTPARVRAAAYAIGTVLIHTFGDLFSAELVGRTSVGFATDDSMSSSWLGQVFSTFGAVPVVNDQGISQNQTAGLMILIPAILVSSLILLFGSSFLPRDLDRVDG